MAQITQDLIFQPTSISGCQLWLDAADSSTFVASGNNLTQWNDKSGLGNNATGASGTIQINQVFRNNLSTVSFGASGGFSFNVNFSSTIRACFGVVVNAGSVTTAAANYVIIGGSTPYISMQMLTYESTMGFNRTWNNLLVTNSVVGFFGTSSIVSSTNSTAAKGIFINGNAQSINVDQTGSYAFNTGTANVLIAQGAQPINLAEVIVIDASITTAQRQQIEGYLAWKWGLQGSLPAAHPYKTFAPLANPPFPTQIPPMPLVAKSRLPFTPTQLSGCVLWLDAADSSSMALSGSVITTWRDKSGQGNNATAYNSPTLSGSNVTMNGTNQYFTCPNVSYRPCNIFCVATYTGSGEGILARKGYSTGVSYEFGISVLTTTGLRYEIRTSGGGQINVNSTVSSTSGIQLYEMTYDNTTGIAYFNGTSLGSGTATGPMFSGSTPLFLGAYSGDGGTVAGAYFPGSFQEFIIYTTTPTIAQRQQIEGYLSWKWGLAAKLPAGHPYKNQPLAPFPYTITPQRTTLLQWLPTQISGCQLWLDGADRSRMFQNSAATTPVTGTGQAVWVWQDKSGSGRNANFGNGNVTLSNAGPYFPNSQGATNLSMTVGSAFGVAAYASSSYGTGFPGLIGGQYAGGNIMYGYLTTAMGSSLSSATVWANGTINGSTTAPNSNNMWSVVSSSPPNLGFLRVGYGDSGPPSTCWQGTISEIIIYSSSLSTSQRQNVEGYLAWKWGLVASLPANHPYKLFPPKP